MCGITGKLNFAPDAPVDVRLIERMNHVLTHRGPDDSGTWSSGACGLGQRRLAIVDLSPNGHQPMCNEDGNVWITFNGEIYNHQTLRSQLEKKGHRYRSQTDTETIIHLYEEYGRDCVQHLRGMFAFAIWDDRKRCLLLARDRFGQKPLIYAPTQSGITFASEIKAILQDKSVETVVNETALDQYLRFGYVPSPYTLLQGIYKLPPAHTLYWEQGQTHNQLNTERYWGLHYAPKVALSIDEAAEATLAQLREATRLRLMSDVPLGAFLSGGIDSSAVVALMAEEMSKPVRTFSIGFDDASFDETSYAKRVAKQYQTEHSEFIVNADALSILPQMVWAYGEPFADSSALPTFYLAQMTSQHVTVALSGDGGDELFAGYERYVAHRLSSRYAQIPHWIRSGLLQQLAQRLPEPNGRKNPVRRVKNFMQAQALPAHERYLRWLTLIDQPTRETLYTEAFTSRNPDFRANGRTPQLIENVDQAMASDIDSYLPDDLLVKVDIATMWHSLEARSPFLDHHVAEFAASLPESFKLRRNHGKFILKQALKNHLPPSILYRQKAGFAVPIGRWFREDLKETAFNVLLDQHTISRNIFQSDAVEKMLREHQSSAINHRYRIWTLLMLELWLRTYLDRPRSELVGPLGDLF